MAILTREDGLTAKTPLDAEQAEAAGFVQCASSSGHTSKEPCNFYISPETQSFLQENGGYYTCPACYKSHDLLHELPWHGLRDEQEIYENQLADQRDGFTAGGGTRVGLRMTDQAQIGEDLVYGMGEIPGFGKINWWHEGGAAANSPLDGSTEDWGVEVKTIGYDSMHHRFIPGREEEKKAKNADAVRLGKKGVLGVLVLLDYRRSVADIFVRPYPSDKGIGSFRSRQQAASHLVKEIPFKNPLLDPHDPAPYVYTEKGMLIRDFDRSKTNIDRPNPAPNPVSPDNDIPF